MANDRKSEFVRYIPQVKVEIEGMLKIIVLDISGTTKLVKKKEKEDNETDEDWESEDEERNIPKTDELDTKRGKVKKMTAAYQDDWSCPILTDLMKKTSKFVWGREQKEAFKKLKEMLLEEVVLKGPE
ncbi:hypothetical protein C2G38_2205504 [Gigaspora rosea]|uniref:Reverse transcriptase/retrotransposon-derived protein RNase H-like domain-containing protein n=1 Tax=Gigaspora rosea TaxID=44941 RepID=A0A397UK57_9GLOM|nr:hypothetical protein C2G38_2205504 [Gigaspora rosea]